MRLTRAATRLADPGRSGVCQRIDGASAEPPTGDADDDGYDDRRHRVGPGISERNAESPTTTASDDHMSEVEMERVRFQRLARSLCGCSVEHRAPKKVDDNGK
jgi:hypothetical protein